MKITIYKFNVYFTGEEKPRVAGAVGNSKSEALTKIQNSLLKGLDNVERVEFLSAEKAGL